MAAPSELISEVDIVFAGGGTAACVAAGRLAKANPDLKVLLVEIGDTNLNNPAIVNPAIYPANLAPGSKTILVCTLSYLPTHFPFPKNKTILHLAIANIN